MRHFLQLTIADIISPTVAYGISLSLDCTKVYCRAKVFIFNANRFKPVFISNKFNIFASFELKLILNATCEVNSELDIAIARNIGVQA